MKAPIWVHGPRSIVRMLESGGRLLALPSPITLIPVCPRLSPALRPQNSACQSAAVRGISFAIRAATIAKGSATIGEASVYDFLVSLQGCIQAVWAPAQTGNGGESSDGFKSENIQPGVQDHAGFAMAIAVSCVLSSSW